MVPLWCVYYYFYAMISNNTNNTTTERTSSSSLFSPPIEFIILLSILSYSQQSLFAWCLLFGIGFVTNLLMLLLLLGFINANDEDDVNLYWVLGLYNICFILIVKLLIVPVMWMTYSYNNDEEQYVENELSAVTRSSRKRQRKKKQLAIDSYIINLEEPFASSSCSLVSSPSLQNSSEEEEECCTTTSSSSSCAICLQTYQDQDVVAKGQICGHVFHLHCLNTWLEKSYTCPYCRHEI